MQKVLTPILWKQNALAPTIWHVKGYNSHVKGC